jgi:hypothetical protein
MIKFAVLPWLLTDLHAAAKFAGAVDLDNFFSVVSVRANEGEA